MILNLTQHAATPEQIAQGVVEMPEIQERIGSLLTFDSETLKASPNALREHITDRAWLIVDELVLPVLMDRAQATLSAGGYECPRAEAYNMLRPEQLGVSAMIGGAPYLMAPLERALRAVGVRPLYALSERVSEETIQPDGSTKKIQVFKHLGFVEACPE